MMAIETVITIAVYIVIISILATASLYTYNEVATSARFAAKSHAEKLQCIEATFISTAVSSAKFNNLANTCIYVDNGLYTGGKHAA